MSQYKNDPNTALSKLSDLNKKYQTPDQIAAQQKIDALINQIQVLQKSLATTDIGQKIKSLEQQVTMLNNQMNTLDQQLSTTPTGKKMTGLYNQLDQARKNKNALSNPYADVQKAITEAQQKIYIQMYSQMTSDVQ